MPAPVLRVAPAAAALAEGFDRIREEMRIPAAHPPDALAEAAAAAARGPAPGARVDRRDLPLVTIDPAGSRDLDQAVAVERRGDGFRVRYAIADVAAFVAPGGPLDAAARERGVTVYMPDRRSPLHPDALGEGAASLLPGQERAALLWTVDLDAEGREGAVDARAGDGAQPAGPLLPRGPGRDRRGAAIRHWSRCGTSASCASPARPSAAA